MKKLKLNQIVAVESGVKKRATTLITKIYQSFNQVLAMSGMRGVYTPQTEDGEKLPSEQKLVELNVLDLLQDIRKHTVDLFDVTFTKDCGNMVAKADIVVDGVTLLTDVPVTYLLFLEKQLTDLRTEFHHLPTLPTTHEWHFDEGSNYFVSNTVETARTKKIQTFVVVEGSGVPDKGVPPQVKEVTQDVIAGYWARTAFSATLQPSRRVELVERADKLLRAVKFAREQANNTEIEERKAGDAIFDYLLK